MKVKHIYWFSYYNLDSPSVRYRAKYALEELHRKENITYNFVFPSYKLQNIFSFTRIFLSVLLFRRSDSVIVFQKIYTNRIYSTALKTLLFFRRTHTVYDIDDAEYEKVSAKSINYFIRKCKTCTVGSNSLLRYAKTYNENTHLLTSPVINHNFIKSTVNDTFTIGWIGFYNAHKQSLEGLFFPSIRNVDFKLKLTLLGVTSEHHKREIRNYFNTNNNITIDIPENIDWHNDLLLYDAIKNFDVGIAPLLDSEINRAKSAFKAKQYLSCGVPVLGSSVGENIHIIKDGTNGYLCDSHEEYKIKLSELMGFSQDAYFKLSQNAIDSIPLFSLSSYNKAFLKIIKSVN